MPSAPHCSRWSDRRGFIRILGTHAKFRGLVTGSNTLVDAADVGGTWLAIGADLADLGGIAVVGVDTDTSATTFQRDVVDDDVTLVLR